MTTRRPKRPPRTAGSRTTPRRLTRAGVRELDRRAAEEFGLATIVLMETAGHAVSGAARNHFNLTGRDRVLVVCGPGNNGGDGAVAARFLHNAGISVSVASVHPPDTTPGDAGVNAKILQKMGVPILPADPASFRHVFGTRSPPTLIIDAFFGIGLDRPLRPVLSCVIEWINEQREERRASVLAVDIPSGLDADTGLPFGIAVRADMTVTFVAPKVGFGERGAKKYLGRVVVADIGIPRRLAIEVGSSRTA